VELTDKMTIGEGALMPKMKPLKSTTIVPWRTSW